MVTRETPGPKSLACIVRDMCKVCEIVTLNAVKVASDVCLLFLFSFFFARVIKVMGFQKGGIQDVQKSSQMHHGGLRKESKAATVATSELFEPAS